MPILRAAGFTLIELLVALSIAALLVTLAIPSYTLWIADSQIRAAAESVGGGLRFAQGEAVKRNSQVEFIIDPTTGTGGWRARLVADGSIIQQAYFAEGAPKTAFMTLSAGGGPGSTTVTFTGLGGIAAANADATPVLAEVRISTSTGIAGTRNLNVLVGGGASGVAGQATRTGIKICDPKWPATDPKGCPA